MQEMRYEVGGTDKLSSMAIGRQTRQGFLVVSALKGARTGQFSSKCPPAPPILSCTRSCRAKHGRYMECNWWKGRDGEFMQLYYRSVFVFCRTKIMSWESDDRSRKISSVQLLILEYWGQHNPRWSWSGFGGTCPLDKDLGWGSFL